MATFKYTLRNLDNQIEFDTSLVKNWEDTMPEAVLSDTYKSVMRDFSNTYEFTGFAKQFIIKSIEKYGYDCPLFLTVEVGNDNAEMHSFEVLANNMIAEISKMDETEISVNLNFIDSEFKSKLFERDGIKTNLNVLKSIDGRVLQQRDLLNDLFMHDRALSLRSNLKLGAIPSYENQIIIPNTLILSTNIIYRGLNIPFEIIEKDDDDIKAVIPQPNNSPFAYPTFILDQFGITEPLKSEFFSDAISQFLLRSSDKKELKLKLNLKFAVRYSLIDAALGYVHARLYLRHTAENGEVKSNTKLFDKRRDGENIINGIFAIDLTNKSPMLINIERGDNLHLYIEFEFRCRNRYNPTPFVHVPDVFFTIHEIIDEGNSTLACEYLSRAPSSFTKIMFPHEIFERLSEILTGESSAFYSEFFGRPELGYKEYGAGSLFGIANGAMIRQFPYKDKPLNISLEDAFKTYNYIFNLDAWIEERNGKSVFRIEPAEKKPDLKDKIVINIYEEVTRKIDSKKLYTEIKVGYKDQEYEEINGLQAFNGESVFATPLNVAENVLDLINPSRADDIGAEITRRQQYIDNPTKDYRADSHNFVFDCIPNQIAADGRVLNYSLRLPDSKAKITGVFEPELGYNYSISPRRCLQNHSANIRACLVQKDTNSLKFVKSAKNANLSSDFPHGIKYVESDDIIISDLNRAFELPEIYMVTGAKISLSDWQKIKDKPRVKISLMINENEYICSIKAFAYNVAKNTADCELIRLNF
jgi:hypothetical protein